MSPIAILKHYTWLSGSLVAGIILVKVLTRIVKKL